MGASFFFQRMTYLEILTTAEIFFSTEPDFFRAKLWYAARARCPDKKYTTLEKKIEIFHHNHVELIEFDLGLSVPL